MDHNALDVDRKEAVADLTVTMHAPAKLNLGLRIFPRRPDGFHDIESWFVPLSLRDTLTFRRTEALELELSGLAAGLSDQPEKNLAGRAALALAQAADVKPHANIHLHKLIPAGGGLGGGSSDAAATLLALRQLWNVSISDPEIFKLAAQIGSDVPFFIHGQSSICRGRGELIESLPLHRLLFAVLIIPPYGTSTKDVYQAFDIQSEPPDTAAIAWAELAHANAMDISAAIRNDLERSAFVVTPALSGLRDEIKTIARHPVHLSGSGSTLFILADQLAEAEFLANSLERNLDQAMRITPVRINNSCRCSS